MNQLLGKSKKIILIMIILFGMSFFFKTEILSMFSHILKYSARQLRSIIIILEPRSSDSDTLKLFTIAEMYFENKDYGKSIDYCNELLGKKDLEEKSKIRTLSLLAIANFRAGNIDNAQSISDKLIEIDPAWGHLLKGLLCKEVGKPKEAVNELSLSLELDGKTHSLDDRARSQAVNLLKRLNNEP
jgi:tetratricopeptide (TPR) repeat protein